MYARVCMHVYLLKRVFPCRSVCLCALCVCNWIHRVSLGNVSLEEGQTEWAGPHISTVTNRIKPDWVGRQIKKKRGGGQRERERVSGRNQVLRLHTNERKREEEEWNYEVMRIKKRWARGGEGQKGEDDQRRMISLPETMGKAVHVCLPLHLCIMYTYGTDFVYTYDGSFYMKEWCSFH